MDVYVLAQKLFDRSRKIHFQGFFLDFCFSCSSLRETPVRAAEAARYERAAFFFFRTINAPSDRQAEREDSGGRE
jgi:hypothetical protein